MQTPPELQDSLLQGTELSSTNAALSTQGSINASNNSDYTPTEVAVGRSDSEQRFERAITFVRPDAETGGNEVPVVYGRYAPKKAPPQNVTITVNSPLPETDETNGGHQSPSQTSRTTKHKKQRGRRKKTPFDEHELTNLIDEERQQQTLFTRTGPDHHGEGTIEGWRHEATLMVQRFIRRVFMLLVLLAVIVSLLTFAISKIVYYSWQLLNFIIDSPYSWYAKFWLVLLQRVTLTLGAVFLTSSVGPQASGSGIPELRAILAGIYIRGYLSFRTLICKVIGLTIGLGSGLPIGLEGPFIHIASSVGYQLLKLPFFQHLDRTQVLSAACAGGISACFGAPIGGVLFSIEVTSSFYRVSNYWTAFFCAVCGASLTYVISALSPTSLLLFQTAFSESSDPFSVWELFVFVSIGVICGAAGAFFVKMHELYVRFRNNYQRQYLGSNPYVIALVIASLYSLITFALGDFMVRPYRMAIHDLFTTAPLESADKSSLFYSREWNAGYGQYFNLSAFIVVNFIFTILSVTLHWPCGVFAPVFALGAAMGRMVGEGMDDLYAGENESVTVAASYAVVGAASLAGGVTRTVSAAVIALEVTRQIKLLFPCLLAVTVACGVSSQLMESIYDSILNIKEIPILPVAPRRILGSNAELITAIHVMDTDVPFLTPQPTKTHLLHLMQNYSNVYFPVVHDENNPILIGEVSRSFVAEYLTALDPPLHDPKNQDEKDEEEPHISQQSLSIFNERFSQSVNQSPFQVIAQMPLSKVFTLFHILRPHIAYVTHMSRLIGIITEERLIEADKIKL